MTRGKIILKIIFYLICIFICLITIIGAFLGAKEIIREDKKKYKNRCIQNELFYRENKEFIKQNKKCAVINNEPYIYENGNLVRAY